MKKNKGKRMIKINKQNEKERSERITMHFKDTNRLYYYNCKGEEKG